MSDIELHLHLDGAITVPIARKLAGLGQIELPSEDDEELKKELQVPADCPDLTSFLKCFELPGSLMQTPETLSEAVRLVLDDCEEQGVVYAEIRFAPQFHQRLSMNQEDAVKAALEGLNEVNQRTEKRGTGIHANLILCCMRGEGNEEENRETLRLAEKYLVPDGGVVALDLAGAEALFPTSKYRDLFLEAKEKGIPFTIHAGEADGAGSVRDAVEFGASRIGHGVRSEEDPELVKLLAEKKIPLEMCPTSNRQTHAVEDMSSYPILRYLDAGIPVTLNTDDPAIEGTTLPEEYAYLKSLTGRAGKNSPEKCDRGSLHDREGKIGIAKAPGAGPSFRAVAPSEYGGVRFGSEGGTDAFEKKRIHDRGNLCGGRCEEKHLSETGFHFVGYECTDYGNCRR